MSHSTNSNVNFCDVCDLSFETKEGLYRHQSYDSKHKELLEKIFGSDDEPMERVYDSEEEYYYLRPEPKIESKPKTESKSKTESISKDNTKDIIKPKANPPTKPKAKSEDSIYSRMKYECKKCQTEKKLP